MSAAELSGTIYYTVQDWIQGRVPALDVLSRRVYTTSAVGRIPLQHVCPYSVSAFTVRSSLSRYTITLWSSARRARAQSRLFT